ncbi:thiamine-phosphate diphosphorylase [Anaerosporomusa subterranea]|uniref:Thiamine-phosphate synthase n=1 Tax=Anaerosporomusa subterranea TaxID=1794912 RepID=A0A154BQ33_ANASB|nr:thiamine phosphate synthase [Anaerosporomusa subterranea]KYZ76104.1 thiamine-phosphate diphosphorylase [Anaerosporomusa subterranea]
MSCNQSIDYSLYLVTDRQLLAGKDLAATVEQAILGGATLVQLREKDASTRDFYQQAVLIKQITGKYHVPLIINDRADIALAVDADGLHIGQEDLPLHIARQIVGPEKLIGVSTATLEQALAAEAAGADYLGIGAIFPTGTKSDADSVSLEELRTIKAKVRIPIVAIGGINETNINSVMSVGVDGAAVVSAILSRPDPLRAAAYLRQLIALAY